MSKLAKAILAILAVGVVGTVATVGVLGIAGAVIYRNLPKLQVNNACSRPVMIPSQFRFIPQIPESIPGGGSLSVPLFSGSGEYRVVEEGDGIYVQLPRSIPILGDEIRVGAAGAEINATFQGAPVTAPMQKELESGYSYSLTLCP